ncbi:hypothetical protein Acr_22g0007970 [Actinidia rufa]|uniref:Uncharacterized protein n=1 Tax=Actinidia rufa TaxID=165716 RepID=A0A7J0GKP9_9ERIC|nr:hypothetical protein Acr_22g0007970 [Actinidia rufa]
MARILKESTEIVFGPLTNILMAMLLLVIYVLMGRKLMADRGWDKKSGEGSSREEVWGNGKKDQNQYPHENYSPLDTEAYANAIYATLGNYKGKLVLGQMKPEYKLMTKIIHYNIARTRSEKELKLADTEFLYIMMNSIAIDVAECIWNEMVAFKEKSPPRSSMPFVAMVSQLCKMAEVVVMVSDGLLLPPIRLITMASIKKSTVMSRTPVITPIEQVDIPSTSTAPPPKKKKSWKAKRESYIKKLLCRQSDINHKLDYSVQAADKYSSIPYEPPEGTKESEEEEEEEEEEE